MRKYIKGFFRALQPMIFVFLLSKLVEYNTNWYDDYWYMDVIFHLAGGVATAMTIVHSEKVLEANGFLPCLNKWLRIFFILTTLLFIGVLWEWYEYFRDYMNNTFYQTDGYDLLLDLFDDFVGGLAYLFYADIFSKFHLRKSE